MATTADPPTDIETPPDTRGSTAPLPATTFGLGIASLALVLGGSIIVQILHAIAGGGVTPGCQEQGILSLKLAPDGTVIHGFRGAAGVCHVVEAIQSSSATAVVGVGIALGVAAIAIGFATYKRMPTVRRREQAVGGAVLGIQAVALGGFLFFFRQGNVALFSQNFLNFVLIRGNVGAFLSGAKNTLLLAFLGEFGGIVIGLILSMLALSTRRTVRAPARTYINFFRGTPLIWQLSVVYFGFALGLQLNLGAFTTALIVFSLNTGAYAAEVFRAGIQSIERGQIEAARSLGMSYLQAMRYAIVPQAVRRVIPPLMNEFVILIKDTSLILVLGLVANQRDLFSVARDGYANTFSATFFVFAAIGYLAVTLPLIGLVNAVERRLRSGLVGIAGAAH